MNAPDPITASAEDAEIIRNAPDGAVIELLPPPDPTLEQLRSAHDAQVEVAKTAIALDRTVRRLRLNKSAGRKARNKSLARKVAAAGVRSAAGLVR